MDPGGDTFSDQSVLNAVRPGHGRFSPMAVVIKALSDVVLGSTGPLLAAGGRASTIEQHPKQPDLER